MRAVAESRWRASEGINTNEKSSLFVLFVSIPAPQGAALGAAVSGGHMF
jgi:hypothetical protein